MNRKAYNTPVTRVMKLQAVTMTAHSVKSNAGFYYDGSTSEDGRSRSSHGFWDIDDE